MQQEAKATQRLWSNERSVTPQRITVTQSASSVIQTAAALGASDVERCIPELRMVQTGRCSQPVGKHIVR